MNFWKSAQSVPDLDGPTWGNRLVLNEEILRSQTHLLRGPKFQTGHEGHSPIFQIARRSSSRPTHTGHFEAIGFSIK